MTTTPNHSIVEKIKKLLALANHESTNPNEAATAAARAQALLFEHKISMIEIEMTAGTVERVGQVNLDAAFKNQAKWQKYLCNAVAYGFYCKLVMTKARNDAGEVVSRLCIIGKPADAQAVVYMYTYLRNEVDRLCNLECKNKGGLFRNSYRFGAVTTIGSRLKEQRSQQEEAARGTSKETALAIIKTGDVEISAFVSKTWGKLKNETTSVPVRREDGYQAGARAARDIQLGGGKGLGGADKQLPRK